MSTGNTAVPATALSRFNDQSSILSQLAIGSQFLTPPGNINPGTNFFWYVVVDLTNLNVVVNEISSNETTVPPDVQKYAGNSQYFLFFISNSANGYNVPQSALYTFLQAIGSGPQLDRAEQMILQLGTSTINSFSYVLAATMAEDDLPGFEMFSNYEYVVLTMQFLPVTIDGQTTYAPIQTGSV